MSDDARLDAIEETLMRLQGELEQLDQALQAQMRDQQALTRRIDQLERRLSRLEANETEGGGSDDNENHG